VFRFKEFQVYKDSKEFIKFCDKTITETEIHKDKTLTYQLRSALLSIILNIAEGSACSTDKEFRRFLEISLRSLYEIIAAFDFAFDLNLIDKFAFEEIENKAESLCKQINGFRRSLNKTSK